jgi:hypothetical protein
MFCRPLQFPRRDRKHAVFRKRIREIIRSYTEDEFDVEDVSMRNYAEDVDIAPIELMIVVQLPSILRMVCPRLLGLAIGLTIIG